MENNKSFLWPQGILIALLALSASLSVGSMMLLKPNTSEAQSRQSIKNINANSITAKLGTRQRIEGLKAIC